GRDPEIGVRLEGAALRGARQRRDERGQHQAGSGPRRTPQELTPGQRHFSFAARIASAAPWIARRIPFYVPQRHPEFALAASMSTSVGAGFSFRNGGAVMIIPG